MSIKSREDVNKYYTIINGLVDQYIDKWKIKPSNLGRYLKGDRFNKFLERNGLKDINGSNRILKDIIDDRISMEKDGVMKFESFNINKFSHKISSIKECLYKGVEKSTFKHEKILADLYDTNVGDIDVLDSDTHRFKVKGWGSSKEVFIYSSEEVDLIEENIKEFLLDEILSTQIEIHGISIDLENLIDTNKFNEQIPNVEIFELISRNLNFEFKKEFNGYFIWEKK